MISSESLIKTEKAVRPQPRPRLGVQDLSRRGVLILGGGQLAANIAAQLKTLPSLRYRLVGWVGADRAGVSKDGDLKRFRELITQGNVSSVVVALSERRGVFPTEELLTCRKNGIRVEDGVAFYEKLSGRIPLEGLNPSALIFSDGFRRLRLTMMCKRLIDILLSCVGLITTMPLWILIAIAIKLDSPGPVFFRQERLGRDEKLWQVLKFRTMRWDPVANGVIEEKTKWFACLSEQGMKVTRVGKFLRQRRVDELPQLWNVLKGDISFVGPRADVPALRDALKGGVPYYSLRTAIKPGLTGWAQVRYHYVSSVREGIERHEYDLYYIKNLSLLLDLRIIVETVRTVLLGSGAR
jgi:exopolysaccharide biosynthesis polyprenyl glycosylphosphotransferase